MKKIEKTVWREYILGLETEIVFWTDEGKRTMTEIYPQGGIWNSYVVVRVKNLPNDFTKLLAPCSVDERGWVRADYYSAGINNYFDFHWGITYYEKLFDNMGQLTGVKIGCDYNHLHDDEMSYRVEDIRNDLKRCVEKFVECFPNYRTWCHGNGKYYPLSEMEEKNGYFYSKEYVNKEVSQ